MENNRYRALDSLEKLRSRGLYEPVIDQLQKDFARARIGLTIAPEMEPAQLLNTLHEKLYVLIMERYQDYLNVLYVVDVPEAAVKDLVQNDPVDRASETSFLIVQRVCRKVVLKWKSGS